MRRKWVNFVIKMALAFLSLAICLIYIPSVVYGENLAEKYLDTTQCFEPYHMCTIEGCGCYYGVCFDLVCNTYPAAFVETVRDPFDSEVEFLKNKLESKRAGSALNPVGGGGSAQDGQTNLHYNEAHVFNTSTTEYLIENYPDYRICSYEDIGDQTYYLSESDSINWRQGTADYLTMSYIFKSLASVVQACEFGKVLGAFMGDACMGTWGPTYPRTGFFVANSKGVASAAVAYRALRVVNDPQDRTVEQSTFLDKEGLMQIGSPGNPFRGKPLNCFPPGTNPMVWDNVDINTGKVENKSYVWVWWQFTCCCKETQACEGY